MLPIVIRSTEEMLRLVPDELREGSYALGNRKWRTILTVVLPAALRRHRQRGDAGGRPGGGRDRALCCSRSVVHAPSTGTCSKGANTALSLQIFGNAQQPFVRAQDRAWGAALTLVAIVFLFTVVARIVAGRLAIKHE